MALVPPAGGGNNGGKGARTEAEWLDEIADMAEAFVGNTVETIGSIELLVPEDSRSETHSRRLAEVKQRVEALEALLIECRELSARAAKPE